MKTIPILKTSYLTTLITAFAIHISIPLSAQTEAVVFSVKDVFNISGMGNIVTGKVESGTIQPGIELEARGRGEKIFTLTVGKVYLNNKEVASASKDEQASFQVKGVKNGDLRMGMVISTPALLKTVKEIIVSIKLLPREESGHSSPLKDGATVQLILHDHLEFAIVKKASAEGTQSILRLKFTIPVAARLDDKISLKQNGKFIGEGAIVQFPDNSSN